MSRPIHAPSGDPSQHGYSFDSVAESLDALEYRIRHAEPVVRDFNRQLTDLIGQCPNTACGNWVTLDDQLNVTVHVDFADMLRLATAFQRIGRELDFAELRRMLPSRKESAAYVYGDLFAEQTAHPAHLPTGAQATGINQQKGGK